MTETAPRSLDVPPAPVRGPRGGGRAGFVVLVAVIAAVAGAIGIAQIDPSPTDTARISSATPTPAPSANAVTTPTPSLDPAAVLAGTTPRMNREALAAAVAAGALDGRLVFVDGTITHQAVHCLGLREPFGACVALAIPGLGVPVWQGASAIPWPADPPPGAWLVTVAAAGGLVYLGSLVPQQGEEVPVADIAAQRVPATNGTLFEATGYLVQHPVHTCFRPGVAATPCPPPPPFLAQDEPTPDGLLASAAGSEVVLAGSMPEVDAATLVTPGTFLVQRSGTDGGSAVVVARYVPSRAVRVQVP